jgi:chromosome segregation ATPase
VEHGSVEHQHIGAEELARLDQALADGQAQLNERRTRRHTAHSDLKSARGQASDLSWELEDLEQRLRDLKGQREGPGDPLLDRELVSIAARRAELEERVLAQMLLVDELARHATAEEQALGEEERAWTQLKAALEAERARITGQLGE